MPSLGSGLSLGTISRINNFDFDASSYIIANNIPNSAQVYEMGNNILLYSNSFSTSSYWNIVTCSLSANQGQNPFNTANDAWKVENTNVAYGTLVRKFVNNVVKSSRTYIFSVYAKGLNTLTSAGLRVSTECSGDIYTRFNLNTGVATAGTPSNGTLNNIGMTLIGNGWYRCFLRYTTSSTLSGTQLIDIAVLNHSGDSVGGSPTGTHSMLIWGAQLEEVIDGETTPSAYSETDDKEDGILRTNGTLIESYVNPQTQINSFVKQIKELGFWGSFICWPTRHYQCNKTRNSVVSSGTIPSLGGLGNYAGTIQGNVTFRDNGIFVTNASGKTGTISVNYPDLLSVSNVSSGSVYKSVGYTWSSYIYWIYGNAFGFTSAGSVANFFREADGVGTLNQMRGNTLVQAFVTGRCQTKPAFLVNTTNSNATSNSKNYRNSTLITTQTAGSTFTPAPTGTSTSYRFGGSDSTSSSKANGQTAFHFVVRNYELSQAEVTSIYNIYKSTLGAGLGLP
jgi:hypothetical protein